jgi:two-component system chemotaxis response regulator CheB
MKKVRILIVDSSPITRNLLLQILQKNPNFEVVGMAFNGKDAISMAKLHLPDVIIMDVNLPILDGLEATKVIMAECPTGILIFTTADVARIAYSAIEAGAIDILAKPEIEQIDARFSSLFLQKIESTANAKIHNKNISLENKSKNQSYKYDVVCIGAAVGGTMAVQKILQELPVNFPVPVLISLQIDKSFDVHYVQWLKESCKIKIQLASDGIIPLPGTAYVSPAQKHLTVSHIAGKKSVLRLVDDDLDIFYPSVDKLFSSVADVYKDKSLGIILSGIGKDGAQGCVDIFSQGGYTIAESDDTSEVFGTSKIALESGGVTRVLSLDKISSEILNFFE